MMPFTSQRGFQRFSDAHFQQGSVRRHSVDITQCFRAKCFRGSARGGHEEDSVLVCATVADAKSYAASHKNAMQSSIAGGAEEKACVITKVMFIPGKQGDRIEHSDATYAITEILIVAVKTPYGVLRMRPNVAYALLRLNETPV